MADVVVRVLKLDGSVVLEVNAKRSWTVIDVKKEVTRSDGTPWKEQKLLIGEKEMTDMEALDAVLPQEASVDVTLVITQNLAGAWAVLTQDKLSQNEQSMREDAACKAEQIKGVQSSWAAMADDKLAQDKEAMKSSAVAEAEAKKAG